MGLDQWQACAVVKQSLDLGNHIFAEERAMTHPSDTGVKQARMRRPVLTYSLLMASSRDAGNANMRKHCRTAWNEEDWNVAAEKAAKLIPYLDERFARSRP